MAAACIRRSLRRLQRSSGGRREEQADRRTAGGDQPGRGHGPADGNFRGAVAREILGVETIDVVADRGYFKIRRHRGPASRRAAVPHVAKRCSVARRCARACFCKDEFRYDAGLDAYVCPAGKVADARSAPRPDARSAAQGPITATRKPAAPGASSLRARCTNNAWFRSVFRLENEDVLDRMAERLCKARPAITSTAAARSSNTSIFGSIKRADVSGAPS